MAVSRKKRFIERVRITGLFDEVLRISRNYEARGFKRVYMIQLTKRGMPIKDHYEFTMEKTWTPKN